MLAVVDITSLYHASLYHATILCIQTIVCPRNNAPGGGVSDRFLMDSYACGVLDYLWEMMSLDVIVAKLSLYRREPRVVILGGWNDWIRI